MATQNATVSNLPILLESPLSSNVITFQIASYNRSIQKQSHHFYSENHNIMDARLAVSFLDAFIAASIAINKIYQFNIVADHGPLIAEPVLAILNYINDRQIDCIPSVSINDLIDRKLLVELINNKCLFQISFNLTEQDFISIKKNGIVDRYFIEIIKEITKAGLPWIYHSLITQENVKDMPTMLKFASNYGASGIVFKMNDNSFNEKDDVQGRPDLEMYLKNLVHCLKLSSKYRIDVVLHEMKRFQSSGNTQKIPSLILQPDGFITFNKRFDANNKKKASSIIIGQYTAEQGIIIFQENLNKIIHNFSTNLKTHCTDCTCFKYCRGRNTNMHLFMEQVTQFKDEYRCELTRSIYKLLDAQNKMM